MSAHFGKSILNTFVCKFDGLEKLVSLVQLREMFISLYINQVLTTVFFPNDYTLKWIFH